MRRSLRRDQEAGAVMVMVALLLPLLVIFTSFAVDAAHFWDFSRNLQNRADAAAFAAGDAFGGTCFGSPTSAQLNDIGHAAQQYSGPPGTPPGNGADLPYPYTDVSNYQNTTNNPGANTANFHLRLNAAASADHGGVNFEMGNFCNATYTNPSGPAADVWVTQEHVPLFFPLLGFRPNISAHARVSLEGEAGGSNIRPIAVSDPGAFGCVTVNFRDSVNNALLATEDLTETDATNFVWQTATPVSLHMPTNGDTVYMQPVLSDCSGDGQTYDDSTNTGIELINSYGTGTPDANQPPKVTSVTIGGTNFHGVTLSGSCSAGDQYFYVSPDGKACNVQPQAVVAFSGSGSGFKKGDDTVTAVDTSTGASLNLSPNSTGTVWTPTGNNNFQINDSDGLHPIKIDWTQTTGAVNGTTCGPGNGGKPPLPCTGTLGVQAQAFGACNGCDQPNDSGPIILSQLHLLADVTGDNSFQQDTTPQLYVKLQLAGIRAQTGAAAPDIILRFSGSSNHQTGLVDCGQGSNGGGAGTSADAYTIYGGCGPNNPFEPPQCTSAGLPCKLQLMNPLFVYGRGSPTDCSPAVDQNYTNWPSGNHQDCVQTLPGSHRVGVVCGLLQRIVGVAPSQFSASSNFCNSSFPATCPTNNWPNTNVPGDHRKIDVVLTAPLDLAAADNAPQFWIPIRKFATFYVTGWDQSLFPNCGKRGSAFGENDDFPGKGRQSPNGAIWGHWINDVDPGGSPDGNPCDLTSIEPVNCVPALTR